MREKNCLGIAGPNGKNRQFTWVSLSRQHADDLSDRENWWRGSLGKIVRSMAEGPAIQWVAFRSRCCPQGGMLDQRL